MIKWNIPARFGGDYEILKNIQSLVPLNSIPKTKRVMSILKWFFFLFLAF